MHSGGATAAEVHVDQQTHSHPFAQLACLPFIVPRNQAARDCELADVLDQLARDLTANLASQGGLPGSWLVGKWLTGGGDVIEAKSLPQWAVFSTPQVRALPQCAVCMARQVSPCPPQPPVPTAAPHTMQPLPPTALTARRRCATAAWRPTSSISCPRRPSKIWRGGECGSSVAWPAEVPWGCCSCSCCVLLKSTSRQATAARSLVCRCPPSPSSRRHKFYRSLLQCAEALCCDATTPLLSWHSANSSRTIASSLAGLEAQVGGWGEGLGLSRLGGGLAQFSQPEMP